MADPAGDVKRHETLKATEKGVSERVCTTADILKLPEQQSIFLCPRNLSG